MTGFWEESLSRYFETDRDPKPWAEAMKALYEKYRPKTIALSIDGKRGVTRSLTRSTYDCARRGDGPGGEGSVRAGRGADRGGLRHPAARGGAGLPADGRAHRDSWPGARSPRRSSGRGRPGWATSAAGCSTAPGTSGSASGSSPTSGCSARAWRRRCRAGFLAISDEGVVIERGDVVHLDFGFSFMGLSTDFQRMAYVLREGEKAAPAGLEAALANTRVAPGRADARGGPTGRLSAEVYDGTMAKMKALGITAQIYSHPLGFQGHALGPSIDMRAAAAEGPLRARSARARTSRSS